MAEMKTLKRQHRVDSSFSSLIKLVLNLVLMGNKVSATNFASAPGKCEVEHYNMEN